MGYEGVGYFAEGAAGGFLVIEPGFFAGGFGLKVAADQSAAGEQRAGGTREVDGSKALAETTHRPRVASRDYLSLLRTIPSQVLALRFKPPVSRGSLLFFTKRGQFLSALATFPSKSALNCFRMS